MLLLCLLLAAHIVLSSRYYNCASFSLNQYSSSVKLTSLKPKLDTSAKLDVFVAVLDLGALVKRDALE